jgi:NAD(P)-dependent dehydrogenase (short-subunit alcohol dehydrogenase family)
MPWRCSVLPACWPAGGGSGTGLALARQYAGSGASVTIIDVNETPGTMLSALKGSHLNARVKCVIVDVGDSGQVSLR